MDQRNRQTAASTGEVATAAQLASLCTPRTPRSSPASASASETAVMTIGRQCTTAGSPGTWTPIYSAALPSTVTVTATAATLSAAARVILLNAATGPTVALPDVTTRLTGTLVSIKNIANNSATLTPLGTNGYADAAAITLTQYQVISLAPGPTGSTIWYKVG
jgi:hypothetical protein